MREAEYQRKLVKKLRDMFPGCSVLENDSAKAQGAPDLLVLFKGFWAMLEVKASARAAVRPNQEHWVKHFNGMSFASFIFPENEEKVLSDLQSAFRARRSPRIPKPKQLPLAQLRRSEARSKVLRSNGGKAGNGSAPARPRSNSARSKAS